MADPKPVLKEYGLDAPEGMGVRVVDAADSFLHIKQPAPPAEHMEISDKVLTEAAGGSTAMTLVTSAPRG
jgi:hypothetical protein